MEDEPIANPAAPPDLSPEARRRDAIRWRKRIGHRIKEKTGLGSRAMAVAKRVASGAWNDGFIHAGNLAYMSILALFPFFIAVSAIFSAIGEERQRIASISAFLSAVPPSVASVLEPVARDVVEARQGWLLWVGGLFGVWTASSLIETIRDILHRAYGTPASHAFWRYRLASAGLIFGSVLLLLIALSAQVVLATAQEVVFASFPWLTGLLDQIFISHVVGAAILFGSIFVIFLMLTPQAYRGSAYPKWPGAFIVTVWWVATTVALPRVLRAFFTYDLTYGSLAGVMIALFFFWLVGLGMVVGAELNAALAETPEEKGLREDLADPALDRHNTEGGK